MREIRHRELATMLATGAQIVDVLPYHEYNSAHIHGAIHIPLGHILRDAPITLDRTRPVIVYCRDCLCDLSARAAAQLELLGFTDVRHYFRGKVDWMERGLPMYPPALLSERVRAFRYFVNNLAPELRKFWIHYTDRVRVAEFMRDDLVRLSPEDSVPPATPASPMPRAVVLNSEGILLGAIEQSDSAPRSLAAMNPAPQTIRPDMTPRLATQLLVSNRHLLVTTAMGKYLGRYLTA
ncbi:MAG: rhodanese-like domain-containing protein [Candidatus Binatus sp.]|jgi:rhodanese-related sulfurtransferase|uniref:rhodanese-like domain-containing protein n=1 Tax=Candidatus Binatus sp. TaxID=2811406 RepID=UPI003C734AD5